MKSSTTSTVPLFLCGARGMLAGELLRLAELHPGLELVAASSREPGAAQHRHLPGAVEALDSAAFERALADRLRSSERVALVLALPHGESARTWSALRTALGSAAAERIVVVDLAADYRLGAERYRAAYGRVHTDAAELARFVYGLPELERERLRGATRIAAPGCFATALQLALVPAAEARLALTSSAWVVNGITGSSGSGIEPKATTHHPHRHDNLWAYSVGGHRHEAELEQALEPFSIKPPLAFVAHSGPFARGIHLTATLPLRHAVDGAEARAVYAKRYASEPFVEVLPAETTPDLRSVVGSNRASLAVEVRGDVLVVLLTLDNLIKGGAGQALQCLNLALGFPETTGLARSGLGVS
jgi:N-acetyl-gamma-glutamyl-phosphate reductase